jgi:glycosyltransferase involved in cell wall biosynthesis
MIKIFTPSFADESDSNAQNLTVKEVVARLDPEKFRVTMLKESSADPRIAARPNTRILQWRPHGNTLRTLLRCLRDVPDVYFFPREGPLDAGFLQLRRRFRLKTALVTYVVSGGELDRGKTPRPTLARNIREADIVVGNSQHMTSLLHERIEVEVDTVHDGIDRRYFYPPESAGPTRKDEPLTVLFAGSLRLYKRADVVVRQAARWPRVNFRIAGRGEEEAKCCKLVTDLGCSNVSFLGHLTSQQLGEEMRRADIFFFPSVIEGHPQVLGQAAASGLPALATDLYHPDFVVDGETGFLAGSDDELAQKLDLLLTQPELRQAMGQAAILHARQFDWDSVTTRWQTIFEKAVSARGRH